MTSAIFVKVGFWVILILGIVPSLFVVGGILFGAWKNNVDVDLLVKGVSNSQEEMFVVTRHAGWSIGPIALNFHPRVWAAGLSAVGIVFLVTGLVILLHVPFSSVEIR